MWKHWFENEKLAYAVLETQHTQTCWSTNLLRHDIVCAFTRRICTNPNALKIQAFFSHFSKSIEDGRPTGEYCYGLNANILSNDLLIIPIHHEGTIEHWTVVGIFINEEIVVQLDLLHERNERIFSVILCYLKNLYRFNKVSFSPSQWTLISPTDVPRQADAIHCSVYACMNAYSLVNFQLYPVSSFHTNRLLYYIVHTANKDNSRY